MTVGIDLGDRFSHYATLDATGELVAEGRFKTSPAALELQFRHLDRSRVVIEVGSQSPWVSRTLGALGHEVIVANARRVRLIAASTQKTDKVDAETLARLARLDPRFLHPVQHRDEEAQAALAVVRSRQALVRSRTLLINHSRGTSKAMGVTLPPWDATTFHKHAVTAIPELLQPALLPLLEVLANLTQRVRVLDRQIEWLIQHHYPVAQHLQQIPGVGPITALTFVLVIGDPNRFRRSREVGPFLGLVPRQRQSGARAPQLGITKSGDGYLRQLLVEAAHFNLGRRAPDSTIRRWAQPRLQAGDKNTKRRTIAAVARRLAVLMHHLWVTGGGLLPGGTGGGTASMTA
jgi:transposase